jgi:Arylsulfotransferase (ASST)
MGWRGLVVGLALLASVGVTAARAAADPVQITGPSLTPAFDENIADYTVRCDTPVALHVVAPSGVDVSVDDRAFQTGTFDASVTLQESQGLRWVVRRGGDTTTYHARCLPGDFPPFAAERPGQPQAQWYIVTPNLIIGGPTGAAYVAIFDNHGVPVWWSRSTDGRPIDAKLLPNGHLAWATPFGTSLYAEHAFDSDAVLHTYQTVGAPTDFHDLQVLSNGNVLLISYPQRSGVDISAFVPGQTNATVVDAEIQEIDPNDGHLVWSWNSKDHIALDETGPNWWSTLSSPYDLVHMNSVAEDGDGIIFSARHLDAVYRINKATGDVDWKLGGTHTDKGLTVVNDPFGGQPFAGQHDARPLGDGSVTVHDNGTTLGRAPRAVRYRIDPVEHTAELLSEVTDPQITGSLCCGSARRLNGGDWVMSWGANSVVEEMAPPNQRVFALTFANSKFSYRAVPITPGQLSAGTLRTGMDRLHPRPPVNVTPPPIKNGDAPVVGAIMTSGVGAWRYSPTAYARQWMLCDSSGAGCADIEGKTGEGYRPVVDDAGHSLRVRVVATNALGDSAPAVSAPSGVVVLPVPLNTRLPGIKRGAAPVVGTSVGSSVGAWKYSPTSYARQWLRCDTGGGTCEELAGKTRKTYTPGPGDVDHTLRLRVVATNASGDSDPAISNPSGVVS